MSLTIQSNVKDQDKVRERREQIIAAAVSLFSQKGFHRTTTRELAKASGLSNGALYEYVQSKEDVLFLVCEHIHREMEEQLRQSQSQTGTGAQRLRAAIQGLFTVVNTMQDEVLLIYQESKSLPPSQLQEVLKREQQITALFEQLLNKGITDASLLISPDLAPLMAHNIVVSGQSWAFRRWAMKGVDFPEFVLLQVRMLMQACGERK